MRRKRPSKQKLLSEWSKQVRKRDGNMTHLDEYYKIIDYRKTHPLDPSEYGEKHHIKPRSLYPDLVNDPNNIVRLSAAEHFVAHYHLWKYYKEELKDKTKARSMCFAFTMMKRVIQKSNDIVKMSLLYSEVREEHSKFLSELNKTKKYRERSRLNGLKNKGRRHSEEIRKKISEAGKGRKLSKTACEHISDAKKGSKNPNYRGKSCTELTRKKLSIAGKGRVFSEETRKKISEAIKGHIVTEETNCYRTAYNNKGRNTEGFKCL